MIVPDTSAWVEYFRGSQHPVSITIASLLEGDADLLLTECVVMELMAGAQPEDIDELESTFVDMPVLALKGRADFEEAARICRLCRAGGYTLRSQIVCLIAVPVIKAGAELLHNDSDFDAIARHTDLRVYRERLAEEEDDAD